MGQNFISMRDVIVAASGPDERGYPKCDVAMFYEIMNHKGEVVKRVRDMVFSKPIIKVFHSPGFVQIDFIYRSKGDFDLRSQWDLLEFYSSPEHSVDEESGLLPLLVLQIFPKALKYEYHIFAINPIFHTLQPANPQSDPTVIRLVFPEEDVQVIHADAAELNEQKLDAEIEEELSEEEDDFI